MRVCKRCRELGYMCPACASLLLGVSGHDPHTHDDQKQGPPRQVRALAVSSTASSTSAMGWIVVPGTSKWFRIIPPST
jgi:hypothetical protein